MKTRWWDLVSFDKDWIKNKVVIYYEDSDGVMKPLVLDQDGNQVYPKN